MNIKLLICTLASTLALGATAEAQRGGGGRALTLYSGPDFSGQSVTINNDVTNFTTINFNDRALSIRIQGSGSWTVCQHSDFRGVCREITTDVPNLATISLDGHISSARMEYGAGGRPGGGLPGGGGWTGRPRGDGSLTLYAGPNFTGQSINIDRENSNLTSLRFNDRAMSAEVQGRGSWTVCEDANFGTPCRTLSGRVANLNSYGLGNRVSSARPDYNDGGGYGGPGGSYGGPGGGYNSRAGTLVLFTGPNFTGQSIELDREESNFVRIRFNDQAMSAIAYGNESWTVCEDTNFGTPCRTISGRVRNLNALGLGNRISSARPDYGYGGNDGGYGGPGNNYGGGYQGRDGTLVLFAGPNFTGRSVELTDQEYNLTGRRFNDQAMSAIVYGNGSWTVCEDANFGTPCREISGRIPNLNVYRLGNLITSARPNPLYGQPAGGYGGPGGGGYNQYDSITLYAGPNFTGPSVTLDADTYNLEAVRFNDRAMSMTVNGRNGWLLCEHASFGGRCQQFDRNVSNLNQWGLGNRVSSARRY